MIREIVIYPDRRLKLISKEVTLFDYELHSLLDDMFDTMLSKKGVGLAAIQIGVDKRVLIINLPEDNGDEEVQLKENTLEVINPVFVKKEGSCKHQEGCLSIPGVYEDIERAERIVIEYQNRYGEKQTIENSDFLAVALQHEIDHLDGKVFIEKLSFMKRKKFEKEWKKRQK
ncbi:Peptide deformylase [hydrothermal vent metagenome]|uniref:Peptide deformylase n=1 Tax=hydrothermal vent metagenome TaxID=652676 RepID=A0A1W1CKA6_9ZZZZ